MVVLNTDVITSWREIVLHIKYLELAVGYSKQVQKPKENNRHHCPSNDTSEHKPHACVLMCEETETLKQTQKGTTNINRNTKFIVRRAEIGDRSNITTAKFVASGF